MDKSGSALIDIVLMPHMSLRRGYSAVLWGDITDEGSQVEHYLFIHPIYLSNRFCTPWTLSSNMASLRDAGDRYAVGVLGLWLVCFIPFITHNRWQTSLLTNWDITQHFLSSFMLVALSPAESPPSLHLHLLLHSFWIRFSSISIRRQSTGRIWLQLKRVIRTWSCGISDWSCGEIDRRGSLSALVHNMAEP